MPLIHFEYTKPQPAGVDAPATGLLRLRLINRQPLTGKIRTTEAFPVYLVAGIANVELSVTPAGYAWEVAQYIDGEEPVTEVVTVAADSVNFSELQRVSARSLKPNAGNVDAWVAALNSLRRGLRNGVAPINSSGHVIDADGNIMLDKATADAAYVKPTTLTASIESAVRARSDLRPAAARPNTVLDSVSASLMSKLDLHQGAPCVWLGGDSTGTEPTEWFNLAWKAILPRWPEASALAYYWDAAAGAYKTPIIEQGAALGTFSDTFSRVVADIIGSTPDVGSAWTPGTAGKFGADGSKLYRTAADDGTSGSAIISLSASGRKFTQTGVIRIGTTGETGSRQTRLMPIYRGGDNVRLHLAGQGALSARLYVDVAGIATARQIGAAITNAIPAATAPAAYPFSVTVDLDTLVVTAVINGNTITGPLTAAEAASFATATQAGIVSTHATFGLDSINVDVGSPSVAGLKIYNASVASTILQEQRDHLAAMMPVRPDVAFLSAGHNYDETYTVSAFLAAIDAMVSDIRALYPDTPIVVTSQNPRNAPAVRVVQHADRMAALRAYCAARGFGYLPAFEAFVGVPVQTSDGIHPTKSDSVDIPSGSAIWAAVLLRWLEARSGRPLR